MPTDPRPPDSDETLDTGRNLPRPPPPPGVEPSQPEQVDSFSLPVTPSPAPSSGGMSDSVLQTVALPSFPPCGPAVPGYEILGELGRGGMGVVFKARQVKANRVVALKMIVAGRENGLRDRVRFQLEAEAVARLQHPNIVQIFDVGEVAGYPYFSLEFCAGGSLDRQLLSWTPTPAEAADLVETLARAMHHAHLCGVVHRDLKPANILLRRKSETRNPKSEDGSDFGFRVSDFDTKITDFGLAKQTDAGGDVSRTGSVLGTPSYMAPEQAGGVARQATPVMDVYALGAILYECLTGRPPFRGESAFTTMALVLTQAPVPPSRLRRGVSLDLEAICLKCLSKKPEERYASAEALADDLRRYRNGEPVAARPLGRLGRLGKWMRRRPAAAGLLVLAAMLAVVVCVSLAVVSEQLRQTRAALAAKEQAQKDREQADRLRVLAQVNDLRDAVPGAVPGILADLEAARDEMLPRLRELWATTDSDHPGRRMRLALALLPVEPDTVRDDLAGWMLRADDPAEVLLARDALRPHADALRPRLWEKVEDTRTPPEERFRALVALAALDPEDERWTKHAPEAVNGMLEANPLYQATWVKALQPVHASLLRPLSAVYHTAQSAERREFAATVLADYAGGHTDLLTELLLDANARQFGVLFPKLRAVEGTADLLRKEIARAPVADWKDAPLDPAWQPVAAAVRQEIERADGMLAERFALAQSLPLQRFTAVAEALRRSGYRPIRLRPFQLAAGMRAAVVWTRDGADWQAALDLAKLEVLDRDGLMAGKGFAPTDLAGYRTPDADHYAALWSATLKPVERQLIVGIPDAEHTAVWESLRAEGYQPATYHYFLGHDGKALRVAIWQKPNTTAWAFRTGSPAAYEGALSVYADWQQVDISWHNGPPQPFLAVFHSLGGFESAESHLLDPAAHLARCRQLADAGYRPAAIASATLADGSKFTTASVWHRPLIPAASREELARRQANAAAGLLRLGQPEAVWPLFRHSADPTRRSELLARLATRGVEVRPIVDRLLAGGEKDVTARRALILALGDYTAEQLPPEVRGPLTRKLLAWYRDDPDPGVHGAIDWLLRHGKDGPVPRPLDWGQAAKLRQIDDELKRRDPEAARRWYVNRQGQTMVVVQGPVEFHMGSPMPEADRRADETSHLRRIGRSFAVASKPVTAEEFQRFLRERPDVRHVPNRPFSPDADTPVINVSWYMAAQYCNWLSEKEGIPESEWCYPKHADIKEGMKPYPDYLKRRGYRLPTEAEWEFAARAGATTSRYYGSSLTLLPRYAWYQPNARERTWPVGEKRPNDLGLFDMAGDVRNWCQESHQAYTPPQDGKPLEDVEDTRPVEDKLLRCARGASFNNQAMFVRSAYRNNTAGSCRPSVTFVWLGLRPARTVP
jgi:formylglycine-generating enzyme required for sulfatase activity